MKVMISQPMAGKTTDGVKQERANLIKELSKQGHIVVDTVFSNEPPEDSDAAMWYLSKSIEAMSTVDAVVFMRGWEMSRGCRIEYEVAARYGKFIKIL